MNKKGQTIIVAIMITIVLFIATIVMIPPLKQCISTARNDTLNCTDTTSLSTVGKVTCTVVDMTGFYFIGVCLAVGIAFVTGKKTFVGVLTSIAVFIIVSVLINPLKDFIILARGTDYLNCAGAGITVFTNMTCIVFDLWLFYFFVACISAAVAYIFLKKVVPDEGEA